MITLNTEHDLLTRRGQLERTITNSLTDISGKFVEIGKDLREIKELNLFAGEYETFDAYCKGRWKFGSKRAYQLIAGLDVVDRLSTVVEIPTERAARAFARLDAKTQVKVAKSVAEKVEKTGEEVTAKLIEAEVVKSTTARGGLAAELAAAKSAGEIKSSRQVVCPTCRGKGMVWEDEK